MRGAVLLAALVLSACQMTLLERAPQAAPQRATVLADALTLRAPDGYCIDPAPLGSGRGFALLAACARMAGSTALPDIDAIATVQLGGAGSASVDGSEDELAQFLHSAAGRALLSGQSRAESVAQVQAEVGEGAVTVRFIDSASALAGRGPVWRMFFDRQGRIVTLSLRGMSPGGLDARQARQMFARIESGLRAKPVR